jgi:hypothetical protein
MEKKLFNPMIIVKQEKDPINPVVNSIVECSMGEPGVFVTSCGC